MARPITPNQFFDTEPPMAAPSSNSRVQSRMGFLLTSNREVDMMPPDTPKRPRRAVRSVKVHPRPRVLNPFGYPLQQANEELIPAAAYTDAKLENLSPEVRAMQDQARAAAYEQYSQYSDHQSLAVLEKKAKADREFAVRLDEASLTALEALTEPKPEIEINDDDLDSKTVTDSEMGEHCDCTQCLMDDQPLYFTAARAGVFENGNESYILVDSTPSLNSDDVFGAAIPRSMPAPQMQLVMPILTFGNPSSDTTVSSGRTLAPIEDSESTASSPVPSPPINTPAESTGMSNSMVQPASLAARLQEVNDQIMEEALSQSWLEQQIAEAMGDQMVSSNVGEEDWVVVKEEEANEDWFEVVTESIVKSTV